jgi:hypothetical protein
MVALLGEASRQGGDGREFLLEGLALPPLDRLRLACRRAGDPSFEFMEGLYAEHVRVLEDGSLRAAMVHASPRALHELPPVLPEAFQSLLEGSRTLQAAFAHFVRERRGDWSDGFLDSLVV